MRVCGTLSILGFARIISTLLMLRIAFDVIAGSGLQAPTLTRNGYHFRRSYFIRQVQFSKMTVLWIKLIGKALDASLNEAKRGGQLQDLPGCRRAN
jgi:hypothetical protein